MCICLVVPDSFRVSFCLNNAAIMYICSTSSLYAILYEPITQTMLEFCLEILLKIICWTSLVVFIGWALWALYRGIVK